MFDTNAIYTTIAVLMVAGWFTFTMKLLLNAGKTQILGPHK